MPFIIVGKEKVLVDVFEVNADKLVLLVVCFYGGAGAIRIPVLADQIAVGIIFKSLRDPRRSGETGCLRPVVSLVGGDIPQGVGHGNNMPPLVELVGSDISATVGESGDVLRGRNDLCGSVHGPACHIADHPLSPTGVVGPLLTRPGDNLFDLPKGIVRIAGGKSSWVCAGDHPVILVGIPPDRTVGEGHGEKIARGSDTKLSDTPLRIGHPFESPLAVVAERGFPAKRIGNLFEPSVVIVRVTGFMTVPIRLPDKESLFVEQFPGLIFVCQGISFVIVFGEGTENPRRGIKNLFSHFENLISAPGRHMQNPVGINHQTGRLIDRPERGGAAPSTAGCLTVAGDGGDDSIGRNFSHAVVAQVGNIDGSIAENIEPRNAHKSSIQGPPVVAVKAGGADPCNGGDGSIEIDLPDHTVHVPDVDIPFIIHINSPGAIESGPGCRASVSGKTIRLSPPLSSAGKGGDEAVRRYFSDDMICPVGNVEVSVSVKGQAVGNCEPC